MSFPSVDLLFKMKKSLLVTVFTLCFTLDITLAEENQNPSKEDIILIMEKIEKILQDRDYEKFRSFYPQFIEMLYKFWKQNQEPNKDPDFKEERIDNTVEFPETTVDDSSNAILRLVYALLNNEEVKRKRGYHRALCHFKICNMGSKRSRPNYWDMWQKSN